MEAGDLIVGQTNAISPTLQSTDAPAVCPGPAAGGTHPCSLDKHKNVIIQSSRSARVKRLFHWFGLNCYSIVTLKMESLKKIKKIKKILSSRTRDIICLIDSSSPKPDTYIPHNATLIMNSSVRRFGCIMLVVANVASRLKPQSEMRSSLQSSGNLTTFLLHTLFFKFSNL